MCMYVAMGAGGGWEVQSIAYPPGLPYDFFFQDRQQLAEHDSHYFTFLCSYSMYSIILYIKL